MLFTRLLCLTLRQAAYQLRAIFKNFTGTPACYGFPAGDPTGGECSATGFYFLPSPALTDNATQRLTTVRWFLAAGSGDVRC